MKKTMRFFSIAALVAMDAALAACSKETRQETQEQLPDVQKAGPFTLTTVVSRDESEVSKALTGDGVKTFAAGETLAIIYKSDSSDRKRPHRRRPFRQVFIRIWILSAECQ